MPFLSLRSRDLGQGLCTRTRERPLGAQGHQLTATGNGALSHTGAGKQALLRPERTGKGISPEPPARVQLVDTLLSACDPKAEGPAEPTETSDPLGDGQRWLSPISPSAQLFSLGAPCSRVSPVALAASTALCGPVASVSPPRRPLLPGPPAARPPPFAGTSLLPGPSLGTCLLTTTLSLSSSGTNVTFP